MQTRNRSPHGVRRAARRAVAALVALVVVDGVRTLTAIGYYEDRVTVVSHGLPDLAPATWLYAAFERARYDLWYALRLDVELHTAAELIWTLALVCALTAVAVWRAKVPTAPRPGNATLVLLAAAVLLNVLARLYNAFEGPAQRPLVDGVLATRWVAYPLWLLSSLVLALAAKGVAHTVRQTTARSRDLPPATP